MEKLKQKYLFVIFYFILVVKNEEEEISLKPPIFKIISCVNTGFLNLYYDIYVTIKFILIF